MTSTVIYEGDLRTVARHLQSGTEIQTDAPTDNKCKGERFSPTDMVATALASCMATTMGIKSEEHGVDLKGMKMSVLKIMKADPRRIAGVNVTFDFPEDLQINEKQKTILERIADTCPVMESIHPDMEVNVTFNWPAVVTQG